MVGPRQRQNGDGGIARRASGACTLCLLVLGGCVPEIPPGTALPVERTLGESGVHPGQYSYPRALDGDGRSLWVVDKAARVQQIDPETGRAGVWWRMPALALGKPTGITVARYGDGQEAVYIADTHYHRVLVYPMPDGRPERPVEIAPEPLAEFGGFGEAGGQFIYPTDVAVLTSPDGARVERVYVSEYGGNDRISVFDASHRFLFAFGRQGEGLDPDAIEFARPQSMVIDHERRELIVTDACNHRVGRFTLDGVLIGWVGGPETSDAAVRFSFPYGLELLADSTVLVTEFGGARVQRVDVERGESLGSFGAPGRGEGEVATPWASAVIGRETYILDSGNNRVLVTRLPGVEGGRG